MAMRFNAIFTKVGRLHVLIAISLRIVSVSFLFGLLIYFSLSLSLPLTLLFLIALINFVKLETDGTLEEERRDMIHGN